MFYSRYSGSKNPEKVQKASVYSLLPIYKKIAPMRNNRVRSSWMAYVFCKVTKVIVASSYWINV